MADDQLMGTSVYGTFTDDFKSNTEFSRKFSDIDFDEFMFSTNNGKDWLIATKDAVNGEFYDNADRPIIKSSLGEQYTAKWYNRQNVARDPHISHDNDALGFRLYLGGSQEFYNDRQRNAKGGFNVFIRQSTKCKFQSIKLNA